MSIKATGQPTGFIWNTIGAPMAEAIKYFANDKGLGFGVGIIIVTNYCALNYLATWYLPNHGRQRFTLKR